MKKKVLITGSNGVLGRNLVDYLTEHYSAEYELILFDLQHSYRQHASRYVKFCGDIRSKQDVEPIMKHADLVVHCASASPSFADADIMDIIVNGTNNLLECAFGLGSVERFVYLSSTSVYGVPEKAPTYETDEVKPYDAYNRAKIEAEALCSGWREKGRCISVLRPRSFLGPHRLGTFGILYEWASEGRNFPMIGKGNNRYQLLDVEDLCQAIALALTGPAENVNDVFNIGAKEFTTIKEDYQSVLDEAKRGKRIISLPVAPMLAVLGVLEKLRLSPFYKRLYMKLNRDYYVCLDKAEKQLGYRPIHSNKDALIRNYNWYLMNRRIGEGAVQGRGNNANWNQGLVRYVKYFF